MSAATPSSTRLRLATIVPGAATFAAWWLFLGFDPDDDYTVPQCAGLVLALVVIGVVAGRSTRGMEMVAAVLSAGAGISAGCFTSWMDDDTGLFLVGWMMLTPPAFLVSWLVIWMAGELKGSEGGARPLTR